MALMALEPCLAVVAYWVVALELCSGVVACSAHVQAVGPVLAVHAHYTQEVCSVPVDCSTLDQELALQVADFDLAARSPALVGVHSELVDMGLVLVTYFDSVGLGGIQEVASIARFARWIPYSESYSGL